MMDLNGLIDPNSGWLLSRAYDVNDGGQIVGYGKTSGSTHAFLLTIVPEPATSSLLLLGLALFLGRRPARSCC